MSNRTNTLNLDPSLLTDKRNLLKDQVANLLREQILAGRISPGSRLAERDVAEILGISRMPARDALMVLENEGLVVTKRSGRYLVELDEPDIRRLFQVRIALEKLAVELAARNNSPTSCTALTRLLEQMEQAIADSDSTAYIQSDLETHRLIWSMADNPYLLRMLGSIMGPIMMFMASQTPVELNWRETLDLHTELVQYICAGNAEGARQSIEKHLDVSMRLSLRASAAKR